jgi:hypothetical protein
MASAERAGVRVEDELRRLEQEIDPEELLEQVRRRLDQSEGKQPGQ